MSHTLTASRHGVYVTEITLSAMFDIHLPEYSRGYSYHTLGGAQ